MSTPAVRAARRALLLAFILSPSAVAQTTIWSDQLGGAFHDEAVIVPDGAGGAFVGGETTGSLGGTHVGITDAWLARYNAAGVQLWIRQYGTFTQDSLHALTPDGAGGVYAAGFTRSFLFGVHNGLIDGWLIRVDAQGTVLWQRQIGTDADDAALALAPDGAGGVFVGGDTEGSLGGPYVGPLYSDVWMARYDASGNQLWIDQLGAQERDELRVAVPDGAGGVYFGGHTWGSLMGPSAGSIDAWFTRYDASGNQLWQRQVGSDLVDVLEGGAPDGAGGVVFCGATNGSMFGPFQGKYDAWAARYSSAGQELWSRQFGGADSEAAYCAATHPLGGVYVAGATDGSLAGPNAGWTDVFVQRFDDNGEPFGSTQFGTSTTEMPMAIASQGLDTFLIAGTTGGDLGGPNNGGGDAWFALMEDPCDSGTPYCTASTTSLPGCVASIQGVGAASASNPGAFTISSGSIPGGLIGVAVFSDSGTASIPYGTLGGKICFLPPIFRTTGVLGGGTPGVCDGNLVVTLQDLIDASPIVVPGAIVQMEFWARDPDNVDGFLLSNGLQFSVCP